MRTVFIDSSMLFSAACSQKGHSRDLILMGIREEIIVVCSQLVLDETRRNLAEDAPDKLPSLENVLERSPFN
jgi:predicted nucleic acid-binding protein